ncbi:MAG: preprotein translocase subunit SecG [Candidatus Omnitrophica bacterium]|nr:preprotein translocase subunit SecG [Candidatus Omnitrophota bacterium]
MIGLIIVLHVIICILLIILILIQAGRGGGLVDSLSNVESMFGTKTPAFLTRTTTILSILFFITCVSLALLSVKQSQSLLKNIKVSEQQLPQAVPAGEVTKQPTTTQEAPKETTKEQPNTQAKEAPKTQNK